MFRLFIVLLLAIAPLLSSAQVDWVNMGGAVPTPIGYSPNPFSHSIAIGAFNDGYPIVAASYTNNSATVEVFTYHFSPSTNRWEEFGGDGDLNTPNPVYVNSNYTTILETKMIVGADNHVFLAIYDSELQQIIVKEHNTTAWADKFTSLSSVSYTNGYISYDINISMTGVPHLAYSTTTGAVYVVDLNSGLQVGGAEVTSGGPFAAMSLSFKSNNTPILAFIESTSNVQVYEFNGSSWLYIGGVPATSMANPNSVLIGEVSSQTVVVFTTGAVINSLFYNGTNWAPFEPSPTSVSSSLPIVVGTRISAGTQFELAYIDVNDFASGTTLNLAGQSSAYSNGFSSGVASNLAHAYSDLEARSYVSAFVDLSYRVYSTCATTQPNFITPPIPLRGCTGQPITFSALGEGFNGSLVYEWTDEGSTLGFGPSLTDIAEDLQSSFDIYVTLRDGCGFSTTSSPVSVVQIDEQLVITADLPPLVEGCDKSVGLIQVGLQSSNFSEQYVWKANGQVIPNATNYQFFPSIDQQGQTVTVEITNTCGTVISGGALIQLEELGLQLDPVINFCDLPGERYFVTATVTSSGTSTFTWKINTPGDASVSPNNNIGTEVFFGSLTSVELSAELVGSLCPALTKVVIVNLNAPPVLNAGPDITHCETDGPSVNLSASLSGTGNFYWYGGDPNGVLNSIPDVFNPTYVFSVQENNEIGVTRLVAVIEPDNGCPVFEDEVLVTRLKLPTVNAGIDESTCSDRYTFSDATFTGSIGARWRALNGNGSFVPDDSIANATYIFSPADLAQGSVDFIFEALANGCGAASEEVTITLNNTTIPQLNAGIDQIITGTSASLNASLSGSGLTAWSTSGTGSFSAPTSLNPVYTFSSQDQNDGKVELLLRAIGSSTCADFAILDTVIISIAAPNQISGTIAQANRPVVLLKKLNGLWYPVAFETADAAGAYAFENVSNGEYLVYYRNSRNKLVYSGDALDWKDADVVTVSGNSPTVNIADLLDLTPSAALIAQYLSGQDRIVGTILLNLTSLTFGRTAEAGDEKPLQDATVYLTTTDGTRLASTTTDANGSYSFTGLSGETFSIQVEYPSTVYSTPPPTSVTTDGSNSSVDVINAAMIKNRATSASPQNGVTFVWTHLVLYPNPALDQVNIKCAACQEVNSVDWIDYNGRIVATVPARYSGDFEWQIERPALTKGNYILRWNSAAGSQSAPIVLE